MGLIDWRGLMRVGLHELRLTPDQFWRLTPAELRVMMGVEAGAAPLTRARLGELAAAFPDVRKGTSDGDD
jgi:uncharacterized phage protein (TIGR02216 family)